MRWGVITSSKRSRRLGHLDNFRPKSNTLPRRLTAIVYLVQPDWDARPHADGGQLKWWLVPEEGGAFKADVAAAGPAAAFRGGQDSEAAGAKQTLDPRAGRLVLFDARTVMHEVLPTHRKRFALTLWYFGGDVAEQE